MQALQRNGIGMMRAIQVAEHGAANVLKLMTDIPKPSIQPGHVLVRNEFIGVNFIDIYQRNGSYPLPLPFIPGRESAGVVEEVGADVNDIMPGDQVAVLWGNTYAEYSLVVRKNITKVPSGVPLETAAACFLQGLTAAYLTTDCYKVQPGDFVLVPAAAGGTGLLIAQFCKALGATVIGTVSTEAKAEVARAHGVDHAIVYTQHSVAEEVMRLTNREGVQVAFDGVGQATVDSTLASLSRRGKFISFGAASGHITNFPLSKLTKNAISLMRPSLADYVRTQEELDHYARILFEMIQKGAIKPTIHKVYPLEHAADAQADLESGKTIGKLLLKP